MLCLAYHTHMYDTSGPLRHTRTSTLFLRWLYCHAVILPYQPKHASKQKSPTSNNISGPVRGADQSRRSKRLDSTTTCMSSPRPTIPCPKHVPSPSNRQHDTQDGRLFRWDNGKGEVGRATTSVLLPLSSVTHSCMYRTRTRISTDSARFMSHRLVTLVSHI